MRGPSTIPCSTLNLTGVICHMILHPQSLSPWYCPVNQEEIHWWRFPHTPYNFNLLSTVLCVGLYQRLLKSRNNWLRLLQNGRSVFVRAFANTTIFLHNFHFLHSLSPGCFNSILFAVLNASSVFHPQHIGTPLVPPMTFCRCHHYITCTTQSFTRPPRCHLSLTQSFIDL